MTKQKVWWAQKIASAAMCAAAIGGLSFWMAESQLTPQVVEQDTSQQADPQMRKCEQVWRDVPDNPEMQAHLEKLRKSDEYRSCR